MSDEIHDKEPAARDDVRVTSVRPAPALRAARLSADDLIALNEEIAGMARAGLPLDQGLAALAREMGRGRLQRVTAQLAADLEAGEPLPGALAKQGTNVPPFYAALVSAGIRAGRVSEVLGTMTFYTRTMVDLRTAVLAALYYPALILVVSFALFVMISYFLLPQYQQFFDDFKLRLPAVTRGVMAVGRDPFLYVVLPPTIVVSMILVLRLILGQTKGGRLFWTRLVYLVPFVGTLVRSARVAAFTELLAIMVDHGLPLPEAFRLAGAASSDPLLAEGSRQIEQDLIKGLPLGEVLQDNPVVPQLVAWMTAVGELRGSLGPTLHQVAAVYQRQVEMRASFLRSILPPLFILLTAGIVVFMFVFAAILPMIKLIEGLSAGVR